MNDQEKRKDPRTDSHNLTAYVCLDEDNNPVSQGMGRTLNISESGILLETHVFIDPQYPLSLTISLEDDMMDIKGKIAYCRELGDNRFESGIEFMGAGESEKRILRQFALIFKDDIN